LGMKDINSESDCWSVLRTLYPSIYDVSDELIKAYDKWAAENHKKKK